MGVLILYIPRNVKYLANRRTIAFCRYRTLHQFRNTVLSLSTSVSMFSHLGKVRKNEMDIR